MSVIITDENTENKTDSAVEVAEAVAEAITESVTAIVETVAETNEASAVEAETENQWQTIIQTELTEIKSTLAIISQNQLTMLEAEMETLTEIEELTETDELGAVEDDAPETQPEIPETQPEPEQSKQSFWKILF